MPFSSGKAFISRGFSTPSCLHTYYIIGSGFCQDPFYFFWGRGGNRTPHLTLPHRGATQPARPYLHTYYTTACGVCQEGFQISLKFFSGLFLSSAQTVRIVVSTALLTVFIIPH